MTEQRIRYKHPDYDEMVITLDSAERESVDTALDALDTEFGLFVNMAFMWGNERKPEVDDEIKRNYDRVHDRREALLKRRVTDFATYVVEADAAAHWIAGNGELRLFGDLDPSGD